MSENSEVRPFRVPRLSEAINQFRNQKADPKIVWELKRLQVEYGNLAVSFYKAKPEQENWPQIGVDERGRRVVFLSKN